MNPSVFFKRVGFLAVAGLAIYFAPKVIQYFGVKPIADWMKVLVFLFTVLFGVIFQLANKLAELADLQGLGYRRQRDVEPTVRAKISRLWMVAAFIGVAALLAVASSLVSTDSAVGYPLLYAALVAQVLSLYLVLFIPVWFEELRSFRWEIREQEKIAKDREALLKKMTEDSKEPFKPDENLESANKLYDDR